MKKKILQNFYLFIEASLTTTILRYFNAKFIYDMFSWEKTKHR